MATLSAQARTMSGSSELAEGTEAPAQVGMGSTAGRGFAWAFSQMVVVKLVTLGGQIILGRYLLSDAEFGQVASTLAVAEFVNILQRAGLREVLIRRYAHYERWATAAFWMALTMGLTAMTVMMVTAPVIVWLWSAPQLLGLILTASIASPFAATSMVASAKLEATFRFRALTTLSVVEVLVGQALTLTLAISGAGPYSLIVPIPVLAAMRCITLWSLARPTIRPRLHLRRWRFLWVEGGLILGGYLAWTVIAQGDYVILRSIERSEEILGAYYFAFLLSSQTVAIASMSVLNVLLPVLSKMSDDVGRQVAAFLRTVRTLAVLTMPLCVLQAVLAEPGVRFIFGTKWMHAVPMLQILSMGMAIRVAAIPAHSMLKAQGRLRTYFAWLVAYAALFCVLVFIGTKLYGAAGTALGVAAAIAIAETAAIYLCIRPAGLGARAALGVFAAPLMTSLAAGLVAAPFNLLPASLPARDPIVLIAAMAVAAPVCLVLSHLLSPAEVGEIRALFGALRRRTSKGVQTTQ
jgi:O-antigen/teichoic acid export membrane protein